MNRERSTSHDYAPLSALLARIAEDESRERVSISDLLDLTGERAFGALMFVLALPNVIPTPPGTSTILGLPLIILAFQLSYGRRSPWLPKMLAARSIPRAGFAAMLARTNPTLRRVERVLKPRLSFLVGPIAERFIGLALLVLALILFLPIPLGNMLPAVAICVMSLSLIEHDGFAALIGAALGALAVLLVWGAMVALIRAAAAALEHLGSI
jgi:hypothetical protein